MDRNNLLKQESQAGFELAAVHKTSNLLQIVAAPRDSDAVLHPAHSEH